MEFILSSVNKHLGHCSFCLLWLKLCSIDFIFTFLLNVYFRVDLLIHRLCICLDLVPAVNQFSKVVVLIYTPASSVGMFHLLHGFVNPWSVLIFYILAILVGKYVVVSHCVFNWYVSDDSQGWALFHILFVHLDIFFWSASSKCIAHFPVLSFS